MSVNPVTMYNPQSPYMPEPKEVKEYPDRYICIYEESASTGKKVGVGIASTFIPGLGQAINGQWGKAAGFFGGSIALDLLSGATAMLIPMASGKKAAKTGAIGALAAYVALMGVRIWSVVDAVKGAKSNREIVVMKDNDKVNTVA